MEINKKNGDVAFNEEQHLYFNIRHPNRKYTSVTTLISKYHEHFDADFWSSYKALEYLMQDEFLSSGIKFDLLNRKKLTNTQAILDTFDIPTELFEEKKQEILDSYKVANETACERGTKYHNFKENIFYEKSAHTLSEHNIKLGIEDELFFDCGRNNFDLSRDNAILPEYLIYFSTEDEILNLAGQVDLIIKNGNDLYIIDYKTNVKGITSKAYFDKRKKQKKTMFYPINNLDDTTLNHYALQLSLYAWMLQRINPEFNIKLLRIMHIDGNDIETEYDLPYLKDDVTRLLKDYKLKLKVNHYRETGKIYNEQDGN